VGAIDEGYDYIELAPENGGSFIPGEDYYFITLPTTMSKGFTLLFEREDGKIFTRNVNTSVAMSRAMFRYLPNADTEGEWVTPQLTFSPSEINIGALGGSFSIDVTYFGTPHVDASSCDWISVTGSSGDPKFGCSYFFHVEPNTGSERVGVITICSDENCYPVMVTQADGSSVQRLKHHSLGMRFTATWCGYCPRMNKSFAQVHSDLGDKFNIVNFHATSSNLPFSGTPTLMSQYSIGGYPTGIVDGRALIKNYNISYTVSLIKQAIQETEDNYPTTTSVGISSSLSGQTLSVDVNVFALEAGTYKITALLLENGIVSPQTDYDENTTHNDYVHNNTARMSLSPISGTLFDVTSANSNTQFNYNVTVPTTYDKNNLSILVYIQKPFGNQAVLQSDNYGDYYVDNSRIVPVGETTTTEFE
ncbi:MAG: Omp28-related outer membrane protein, partial [Bacteroidales bacterium]|nr:Omp28-related outer membrane protein [Bacteroidales bacterium]